MTTTTKPAPKNKVYEVITNRIIEKIQTSQTLPWEKPWRPGDAPRNLSGRGYTGMNVFLLNAEREDHNYTSNIWLTFNQVIAAGGDVTGQKSTPVIFCKTFFTTDKNGNEEKKFTMRYYNVFNADQVKNFTPPAGKQYEPVNPIEAAEAIVNTMPNRPTIETRSANRACYIPSLDTVQMPPRDDFKSAELYYKTLFHELAHSTQHASRLNRTGSDHVFGSQDYSKEELIAEMTAAFLTGIAGIETEQTTNQSAAYIQSWLTALKNDATLLIQAASAAQKAADYIAQGYKASQDEETEEE